MEELGCILHFHLLTFSSRVFCWFNPILRDKAVTYYRNPRFSHYSIGTVLIFASRTCTPVTECPDGYLSIYFSPVFSPCVPKVLSKTFIHTWFHWTRFAVDLLSTVASPTWENVDISFTTYQNTIACFSPAFATFGPWRSANWQAASPLFVGRKNIETCNGRVKAFLHKWYTLLLDRPAVQLTSQRPSYL